MLFLGGSHHDAAALHGLHPQGRPFGDELPPWVTTSRRKLPIIGTANALLGAILGAILGALMAILLLWLAFHLLPALSEPGGILSPEGVERSFLTKFCFQTFPNLFS